MSQTQNSHHRWIFGNTTAVALERRGNTTVSGYDAIGYSIPPFLAQAARAVAESTPQLPAGNHEEVATRMRAKFALKTNDTNKPPPLKTPEGKLSIFADDATAYSRRGNSYWMVDMGHYGSSPLAPPRIQGDGVSDDTEAINRAVSDGGRCGPNCGSSTIVPAVVYFPPGTYLISSPIIQYYNTEFLGDPLTIPTLLAASSFVGQGVITSDVYISDNEQWWVAYLNTANFLRSVKNFKIDIRKASPWSYMCAIHWQVAQATSLENIEFYMLYESDVPGNNQQGIYMENGSGGSSPISPSSAAGLGKLNLHYPVNSAAHESLGTDHLHSAYFGNQQFTTSHLVFVHCVNALQVHWDWAWTMHDFIIESCGNGLVISGGAGGPKSNGQSVGSLVLVDSIIANTKKGIVTTLMSENSTALLVQNVGFFNTEVAISDSSSSNPLLPGGDQVVVENWGFGMVNNANGKDGQTYFANGASIPAMKRKPALVGEAYPHQAPNLFARRRPKYFDVPASKVLNVKALGAKGDGIADDSHALNAILEGAANTSSIVFFPFGIYLVRDTVRVPAGSRIIGQAWAQIMGTGERFADESDPQPIVQVGKPGEHGIVEIQSMMFTVKGATAGAVVLEWNIHETFKGSAGLWDTHIRVGGAKGSDLTAKECPKKTGHVQSHCKAASLLMHLTPGSTAYIENAWLWTADHDLDKASLDQIDIYSGRGLLVQSDAAWLWGTSVEHNVLYQVTALIRFSQYFQPVPASPRPFTPGYFPNDPTFASCLASSSKRCAVSWAARIVDSASVYILGAGLYSWFDDYKQDCLKTEDCQMRGFEIEQASDIWIYNLCTKAIEEMVSPLGGTPTMAHTNKNGFLSSVLAWLQGSVDTAGERNFRGYRLWTKDTLDSLTAAPLPETCRSALTELVLCDSQTESFQSSGVYSWLGSQNETDIVCDAGCGRSLKLWFDGVAAACSGYRIADATLESIAASIEDMPTSELCSYCWIKHLSIMQQSAYSAYDSFFQSQLQYTVERCRKSQNTTIPKSPINVPEPSDFCVTAKTYTTVIGDTCDSIAEASGISSASLYLGNPQSIKTCAVVIPSGTDLCLPPPCGKTWTIQPGDSCHSIETNLTQMLGTFSMGYVRKYNRWVDVDCTNLHSASDEAFGHVICLGPENGEFSGNASIGGDTTVPGRSTGYSDHIVPPPNGADIAPQTTRNCGLWHLAVSGDTCGSIAFESGTTIAIFMQVNPSLGKSIPDCSPALKPGLTYCAVPHLAWDMASSIDPVEPDQNDFIDDFNDGNLDNWKIYDGSYDASTKALVAGNSIGGKALINTKNFTDFTFEADIVIPKVGAGNAGLVFRAANPGIGADTYNGYYVGFGTDGNMALGRANNNWKHLGGARVGIAAGKSYHVMVQAHDDSLTVYLDDMITPKIAVRDSTYRRGYNGVRVYQTGAIFDNVRIVELRNNARL
ncbi:hypothetical protein ACCO45_010036 [Purpureocillium lilacinum]|uniref:Uncharacterized protein n=1 Tax=Purpureocillium lilacinum TaxID=33203 RepID=A0ACC4DGN0_PURLI